MNADGTAPENGFDINDHIKQFLSAKSIQSFIPPRAHVLLTRRE